MFRLSTCPVSMRLATPHQYERNDLAPRFSKTILISSSGAAAPSRLIGPIGPTGIGAPPRGSRRKRMPSAMPSPSTRTMWMATSHPQVRHRNAKRPARPNFLDPARPHGRNGQRTRRSVRQPENCGRCDHGSPGSQRHWHASGKTRLQCLLSHCGRWLKCQVRPHPGRG